MVSSKIICNPRKWILWIFKPRPTWPIF